MGRNGLGGEGKERGVKYGERTPSSKLLVVEWLWSLRHLRGAVISTHVQFRTASSYFLKYSAIP